MDVSIVITCYDRERFISRAIRSAISQRYPKSDFEVIVVDDASTDYSREIIKDFGDAITPIFHRKNMGLPAARNSGIKKATGRFVVHLDSDDYLHDELVYLELLHLEMNPDWGAAACDYFIVDTNEKHLERKSSLVEPIACGIMFRKENLIEIGLYNSAMRMLEDEELRLRYASKFQIGHIPLPLYRYTRHSLNLTNNTKEIARYRKKLESIRAKGTKGR